MANEDSSDIDPYPSRTILSKRYINLLYDVTILSRLRHMCCILLLDHLGVGLKEMTYIKSLDPV